VVVVAGLGMEREEEQKTGAAAGDATIAADGLQAEPFSTAHLASYRRHPISFCLQGPSTQDREDSSGPRYTCKCCRSHFLFHQSHVYSLRFSPLTFLFIFNYLSYLNY
jgi:hypothetical protein